MNLDLLIWLKVNTCANNDLVYSGNIHHFNYQHDINCTNYSNEYIDQHILITCYRHSKWVQLFGIHKIWSSCCITSLDFIQRVVHEYKLDVGFDHGLPCRVKNMALGPQLRQKPRPSASVFVYWVPRAMFFTRHGRPWSNPIIARSLIDFFSFCLQKLEF